jgi:predicted amino acid-binding ACT domain protein
MDEGDRQVTRALEFETPRVADDCEGPLLPLFVASVTTLRELLEPTTLPSDLVEEMVSETNTLWLLGAPDALVAGEMVLCHPPLGPGEVRAVVNQTESPRQWRVTVVTRDRAGLLAGTSATLANAGLSVVDFATTVLPRSRIALQRITVSSPRPAVNDAEWSRLGRELRSNLSSATVPEVRFTLKGPVVVEAQPQDLGRCVVTVDAPDRLGLLHASASWFEAHGCNVESCRGGSDGHHARDVFIVAGPIDTAALASHLGGVTQGSVVTRVATTPLHLGASLVNAALRGLGGIVDAVT